MPKKEGAKSTRVTLPMEFAEVESFVGVWDSYVFKKTCIIEGCDHIVSGRDNRKWKIDGTPGALPWITCGEGSGAGVVVDKRVKEGKTRITGPACVCCVDSITEAGRAMNGDPE